MSAVQRLAAWHGGWAHQHADGTTWTHPNGVTCPEECGGDAYCTAALHEHGCFADYDGTRCTDPADHVRALARAVLTPESEGQR